MPQLLDEYHVAVIGAGPAGLAAAALCARSQLSTVVLDEHAGPGGHAYRGITSTPVQDRSILGDDYWQGEKLVREALASGAQLVPSARVSSVSIDHGIEMSIGGETRHVQATYVILATGAVERGCAIPGRELAGVTTAGEAQAALELAGVVPPGRTVLAGSGDLLWLAAARMLRAGAAIEAVLETTSARSRRAAWRHYPGFLFSPYFCTRLAPMAAVRRKVRVVQGVTGLRSEGDGRLERVCYRDAAGREESLAADNLVLHHGVVPDVRLADSAGVEIRRDTQRRCRVPMTGAFGSTRVPGIYIAGDAAGIAGHRVAAWRGVLAAADILYVVNPEAARKSAILAQAALKRFGRGQRFLELYFQNSSELAAE